MNTELIARVNAGKEPHWHYVMQGRHPEVAGVWGRLTEYHWVRSIGLAVATIKDSKNVIVAFLWANVVIVDYPENIMPAKGDLTT